MIAYDSNILIYYLERHPEFGQAAREIIRKSEKQGAVLSILLQQEVLSGFAMNSPHQLQTALQAIAALRQTHFSPVTPPVVSSAINLSAKFGRKVMDYDAIHLATALENGVSEFYTNDLDLIKIGKIKSLRILPLA